MEPIPDTASETPAAPPPEVKKWRLRGPKREFPTLDFKMWGPDNILRLEIPMEVPPVLTKSKKCFRFRHISGRLRDAKVITPDGVEREVRMFVYVWAKLTKAETKALLDAEAALHADEPKLE